MLQCVTDELRDGVNPQLAKQIAVVGLDGLDADAQIRGDFPARLALRNETQGLSLSGRAAIVIAFDVDLPCAS